MTARSLPGRGVLAASSQQMLGSDSYVSQAFPIRNCPEWLREKVQSAPFQNGSEAAVPCLISPTQSPGILWPALFLPIKKSPILLEFTDTDQQGKHDRAPYEAVNFIWVTGD